MQIFSGALCLVILGISGYGFMIEAVSGSDLNSSSLPLIQVWSPAHRSSNITDFSLTPHSQFTITVNVTGAPNLLGYTLALYYDSDVIAPLGARFNGSLFPDPAMHGVSGYSGKLLVEVSSPQSASGNGALVFIDFLVVGNGMSPLALTDDSLKGIRGLVPHEKKMGCFHNVPTRQASFSFAEAPSPGFYETSEFMIGKIAVGIIIMESEGSLYNWTDAEILESVSGIQQAMDWWTGQEPNAHLEFSSEVYERVPTRYEPIEMGPFDAYLWIGEAMNYLGYYSGGPFYEVRAFDNDLRQRAGADWAFTIFLVDSDPARHSGNFDNSLYYEYAYFGGPFFVMSRYSYYAWNSAQYSVAVPAHAIAHMFYATDEYNGMAEHGGYLNAPDVEYQTNIMNQNDLVLEESTREQVGWRDCDGDGILDIVDTLPGISLASFPSLITSPTYEFTGATVDVPSPRLGPYGRDLTVNRIQTVRYSFDDEPFTEALPYDGSFDGTLENFTISLPTVSDGLHTLTVESTNSVGNSRSVRVQFAFRHLQQLDAVVTIEPGQISLRNMGRYLTVYVELPRGYDVGNIDKSSILLNDSIAPTPRSPSAITDVDNDGIPELMVKFLLDDVKGMLDKPGEFGLEISGRILTGGVETVLFRGLDIVRVFFPGDVNGDGRVDIFDAAILAMAYGSSLGDIRWNPDADFNLDGSVDIFDAGSLAIYFGTHV